MPEKLVVHPYLEGNTALFKNHHDFCSEPWTVKAAATKVEQQFDAAGVAAAFQLAASHTSNALAIAARRQAAAVRAIHTYCKGFARKRHRCTKMQELARECQVW